MLFCPECGATVTPGDPFCGECGVRLDEPPPPPPPPTPVQVGQAETNKPMSQKKNSPAGQLEPGTLLVGRYLIVRRIGGGGMGSVYLAHDRNLADAPRAVKEMLEMFADAHQREKAIEDFKRESTLLASLEHPSIPTIFDFFVENDRYYLVMKYVNGSDLASKLRQANGIVDERSVTEWAIQTCDVLDYIHGLNPPIIFRDLKPANLMLDERTSRVMLIDFGIARTVAPTQKGVTAIGTMGYAPPELFSGKVDPRSDLYSLGATMFHMITGADPQDNPLLIFDFQKNPRPRSINPAITPEMENILIRSTEYKADNRFSSAREMMQVLEEHKRRLISGPQSGPRPTPADPVVIPQPGTNLVFCGNCGQQINADDLYCALCGHQQPLSVPTAKLIVLETGDIAGQFPVDKESILIGRTDPTQGLYPEVDLTRYDPLTKVSRRHARLHRRGEQYMVEDIGSVNGTYLNRGDRLPPNQLRLLHNNDDIRLGETNLKFKVV